MTDANEEDKKVTDWAKLIASRLITYNQSESPREKADEEKLKKLRHKFQELKKQLAAAVSPDTIRRLLNELEGLGRESAALDGGEALAGEIGSFVTELESQYRMQSSTVGSDISSFTQKQKAERGGEQHLEIINKANKARKDYANAINNYVETIDLEKLDNLKEQSKERELEESELKQVFYSQEEIARRQEIRRARGELDDSYKDIYERSISYHEELEQLEEKREGLVQRKEALEAPGHRVTSYAQEKDIRVDSNVTQRESRREAPSPLDVVVDEIEEVDARIGVVRERIGELTKAEEAHQDVEASLKTKVQKIREADKTRAEILMNQKALCMGHIADQKRTVERLSTERDRLAGKDDAPSIEAREALNKQIEFHKAKKVEKTKLARKLEEQKEVAESTAVLEGPSQEALDKKARLAELKRKKAARRKARDAEKARGERKDNVRGSTHSQVVASANETPSRPIGSITPPRTPTVKKTDKRRDFTR